MPFFGKIIVFFGIAGILALMYWGGYVWLKRNPLTPEVKTTEWKSKWADEAMDEQREAYPPEGMNPNAKL